MQIVTQHLRALASLRKIRIEQLHGRLRHNSVDLSVIYAGNGSNADYLTGLLFQTVTSRRALAEVSPLTLAPALARFSSPADIIVCERAPLWATIGPALGDFRMPAWIRQELSLGNARGNRWKFGRHLDRELDRHMRRHDFRVVLSDDNAEKRTFYREFYLPYVTARHALGAITVSEELFDARATGATLAKLYAGDEWTAGMLLHYSSKELKFGWFGSRANPPLSGASEALDSLCIAAAAERGIRRINFGNARPSMVDGVVRYKRKFGVHCLAPRYPQTIIEWRLVNSRPELREWVNSQQFLCIKANNLRIVEYPNAPAAPVTFKPLDAAIRAQPPG